MLCAVSGLDSGIVIPAQAAINRPGVDFRVRRNDARFLADDNRAQISRHPNGKI
jgi:hypothetical protein